MERMERLAFIGLGIMGSPMAKRLLAAGYPLTVWNRTASRAESLQAEGADVAASPAEAVREADVVITMLADPTAVREVINGIARHLRPGTTLIEASTIGPQALEEVAALLPDSVALIDAPVMGSADRAASGQLVVLAGGNLTKVRPILEVFGTVTECGAVGHGAALKVVLINAVIAGRSRREPTIRSGWLPRTSRWRPQRLTCRCCGPCMTSSLPFLRRDRKT